MEIHAIENPGESQVRTANLEIRPAFFAIGTGHFIKRNRDGSFLAKAHENDVGGETVQPGGEGRFAAERVNFAEQLEKGFLSQIFCFHWVAGHTQTQSVNAAAVQLVDGFKRSGVTELGAPNGIVKSGAFGFKRPAWPGRRLAGLGQVGFGQRPKLDTRAAAESCSFGRHRTAAVSNLERTIHGIASNPLLRFSNSNNSRRQ